MPMYLQLVQQLRRDILSGKLSSGMRLPSSRALATDLEVSRVTIINAYEQLLSEGYCSAARGSGIFVSDEIPDDLLQVDHRLKPESRDEKEPPAHPAIDFNAGPDMRLFPHAAWARLFQQVWAKPSARLLGRTDAAGWIELRGQIASHLKIWRGITCSPLQIFITSGGAESIELIAQGLFDKQQMIAMEEPGYRSSWQSLERLGFKLQPVEVDENGLDSERLSDCRAAVITPSRQFPLGHTMPLARRLQMLKWACQNNGLIIEDDYDSEYRYRGLPLPALMSLDHDERVIYMGSFAKIFSNSLRLSYFIVPSRYVECMNQTISHMGPRAAFLAQPVLARFMQSGAFAAHIRRMRRIYAKRLDSFRAAFNQHLADYMQLYDETGGIHIVAELKDKISAHISDKEFAAKARLNNIALSPLSKYYKTSRKKYGFIFDFTALDIDQVEESIKALTLLLEKETGNINHALYQ